MNYRPTINFIRKMNRLVDGMKSNTEKYGLQSEPKFI